MAETKTVIYKYKNRKLYSLKSHSYVTTEEVLQMAGRGESFVVLDKVSGADLTKKTLAMALMSSENFVESVELDQLIEIAKSLSEDQEDQEDLEDTDTAILG